jgi:hypothetical protein
MNIKNANKVIHNVEDFEKLIVEASLIPDFKNFSNLEEEQLLRIKQIIESDDVYSISKLKKLIQSMKIYIYPSKVQKEYWTIRGHSVEDADEKISNFQRENSNKRLQKYTREDLQRQSVRCTEYWLENGYSEIEAREQVRRVQSNTSLTTLQEKYGSAKGKQIRDSITKQWLQTLEEKSPGETAIINKKKGSGGKKLVGRIQTEEHRKNISKSKIGSIPWNKGKRWKETFDQNKLEELYQSCKTDEKRKKLRTARIAYIEKCFGQAVPTYNIDSIKIIEEYGNKNGYNFLHAENGGEFYIKELGYWLDAYDVEQNVVLEVYERHHYNSDGSIREKDILREKEVINALGCKFVRIKYRGIDDWEVDPQ